MSESKENPHIPGIADGTTNQERARPWTRSTEDQAIRRIDPPGVSDVSILDIAHNFDEAHALLLRGMKVTASRENREDLLPGYMRDYIRICLNVGRLYQDPTADEQPTMSYYKKKVPGFFETIDILHYKFQAENKPGIWDVLSAEEKSYAAAIDRSVRDLVGVPQTEDNIAAYLGHILEQQSKQLGFIKNHLPAFILGIKRLYRSELPPDFVEASNAAVMEFPEVLAWIKTFPEGTRFDAEIAEQAEKTDLYAALLEKDFIKVRELAHVNTESVNSILYRILNKATIYTGGLESDLNRAQTEEIREEVVARFNECFNGITSCIEVVASDPSDPNRKKLQALIAKLSEHINPFLQHLPEYTDSWKEVVDLTIN